jgi:hypothetical protein
VPQLLIDSTTALWAALATPFMARYAVAWTVALRVRGWPPTAANLAPRRQRSDYPAPNDPLRAVAVALAAVILAWPVALILTNIVPGVVAVAAWANPLAVSLIYVFCRMFQDDRRTRDLLVKRLMAESQSAPHEPMA